MILKFSSSTSREVILSFELVAKSLDLYFKVHLFCSNQYRFRAYYKSIKASKNVFYIFLNEYFLSKNNHKFVQSRDLMWKRVRLSCSRFDGIWSVDERLHFSLMQYSYK